VAKHGYDAKYGARPIQRLIQEKIKRQLVDEVLFGRLEKGGHVDVTLSKDGKIEFRFEEKRHEKPGEKAGGEREEAKESSKS
jgi:ATP-dependent Clp protease ATP-binding subunit ClpA